MIIGEEGNGKSTLLKWIYNEELIDEYTEFSGERVKVQLSRILLSNPSVLLLDEPSNDIDVYTLAWLERFILEYPNPIIYISHDETLIEKTANRIVHLERIRRKTRSRYTVANMPYKEYIRDREARMNN